MEIQATISTDRMLRPQGAGPEGADRLCEIFHANSKLTRDTAASFMAGRSEPSDFERYLMTRGFRRFLSDVRIELPEPVSSDVTLSEVLMTRRTRRELSGALTLTEVGALLRQALGCTAVMTEEAEGGLAHALRAWPSAGGLYPLDAYLLITAVEGVAPGLYHFNPLTSELEGLRSRSVSEIVRDAFFDQAFIGEAALHVILAAVFPRTLSKYGERGYRLTLLDAGHAAQNLLLAAEALDLNAVGLGGYCDDSLNRDLHLDGIDEAVVHALVFGKAP